MPETVTPRGAGVFVAAQALCTRGGGSGGSRTITGVTDPLQRLVELEMPYGKYKGTPIADLPGNYLNWFAREGFPPGELGRLLALMHEIDHNGLKHLLAPLRAGSGKGSRAPS